MALNRQNCLTIGLYSDIFIHYKVLSIAIRDFIVNCLADGIINLYLNKFLRQKTYIYLRMNDRLWYFANYLQYIPHFYVLFHIKETYSACIVNLFRRMKIQFVGIISFIHSEHTIAIGIGCINNNIEIVTNIVSKFWYFDCIRHSSYTLHFNLARAGILDHFDFQPIPNVLGSYTTDKSYYSIVLSNSGRQHFNLECL
jgi:hypothetical protein